GRDLRPVGDVRALAGRALEEARTRVRRAQEQARGPHARAAPPAHAGAAPDGEVRRALDAGVDQPLRAAGRGVDLRHRAHTGSVHQSLAPAARSGEGPFLQRERGRDCRGDRGDDGRRVGSRERRAGRGRALARADAAGLKRSTRAEIVERGVQFARDVRSSPAQEGGSMQRSKLLWLAAALTVFTALEAPQVVHAQSRSVDIRTPHRGQRPFQLDIHGGLTWWGWGAATGARFGIPILNNGFVPSINNAVYINFGVDFYWTRRYHDSRGWHYGAGVGFPVALHWEFYFNENWSAFVEL